MDFFENWVEPATSEPATNEKNATNISVTFVVDFFFNFLLVKYDFDVNLSEI